MSKLYATIDSDAAKTQATRRAHRNVSVTAASWHGAVTVELTIGEDGTEQFTVRQRLWHGAGVNQLLASGIVGMTTAERVPETEGRPRSKRLAPASSARLPKAGPRRIAAE